MKSLLRVLGITAVLALASGVCSATSIFEAVNPTQTYGTPSGGGGANVAVWIPLSAFSGLGTITPGSTQIDIVPIGAVCFVNCPGAGQTNVNTLNNPIFIAGFSAGGSGDTSFFSTSLGSFNTITSGAWTNTFANQFGINYNAGNGTGFFTIPTGANDVVIVFHDNFYPDNSATGTFGVDVSIQNSAIPEPASYAMLLGGLGLLAGWRRLRPS